MITAEALLHGDVERLLGHNPAEYPLALQLGGSSPDRLQSNADRSRPWLSGNQSQCRLPVGSRAIWSIWCLLDG